MDDELQALTIKAAEAHASSYEDDDRIDIKTDVLNAFYAGVAFMQSQVKNIKPEANPASSKVNAVSAVQVPSWNAALDHVISGFEMCFNREEVLEVGYMIDSINACRKTQSSADVWKPKDNEVVINCLLTSLQRASAALRETNHVGDSIDASRIDYLHSLLLSSSKENSPEVLSALRTVRNDTIDEIAAIFNKDADEQERVWNEYIASDEQAHATSYHSIPRNYARRILELKTTPFITLSSSVCKIKSS